MGTVCVEIAVRDDPRLVAAVASLGTQHRRPERVLLAAAPETPESLVEDARRQAPGLRVDIVRTPGNIQDARAGALSELTEDVTAILDADEIAPPEWLERLLAPIEAGGSTFSGGPTRPTRAPATSIERYQALIERSIYEELVPQQVTYLPLQNSAWRTRDLKRLGIERRHTAEDHDLAARAVQSGLRGTFVPEAWVYHDKTSEASFWGWLRKRYRYNVGMAMSLLKTGELRGRLAERRRPIPHPLYGIELLLKPVALIDARIRWARLSRSTPSGPSP